MVNTDEIQVAPGSCSLARQPYSIKRSELFYNLRQFKRSQRQGGPGRRGKKGEERGTPVGESRSTGGEHFGPKPAGCPGPVCMWGFGGGGFADRGARRAPLCC